MPRKAKPKKNAKKPRLSENSKAELNKIGDEASSDNLEQCIEDFDTQVEILSRQCLRNFKREMSRMLKDIRAQRIEIPKEVQEMPLSEFKIRGGTVATALESLKEDPSEVRKGDSSGMRVDDGTKACPKAPPPPTNENADPNADLVTPARSTRSRRARGGATVTATTRTTRAATRQRNIRKPQPNEQLDVVIHSKTTGSPVDEGAVLEAHLTENVDDVTALMVERLTAVLPRCHRAKVMRTVKQIKMEMLSTGRDISVTPALIR